MLSPSEKKVVEAMGKSTRVFFRFRQLQAITSLDRGILSVALKKLSEDGLVVKIRRGKDSHILYALKSRYDEWVRRNEKLTRID